MDKQVSMSRVWESAYDTHMQFPLNATNSVLPAISASSARCSSVVGMTEWGERVLCGQELRAKGIWCLQISMRVIDFCSVLD